MCGCSRECECARARLYVLFARVLYVLNIVSLIGVLVVCLYVRMRGPHVVKIPEGEIKDGGADMLARTDLPLRHLTLKNTLVSLTFAMFDGYVSIINPLITGSCPLMHGLNASFRAYFFGCGLDFAWGEITEPNG